MVFGFTLLELLVTMVLIAVVSVFTLPHFQTISRESRTKAEGQYFMHVLTLARSEALLRGVTITVCGSDDYFTCSNTWADGQIVFMDRQNSAEVVGKEDLLSVLNTEKHAGALHWRSSLHRNYLSFYPSGTTHGEVGTFWYCLSGEPYASWAVVVNQVGRIRYVEEASALMSYRCHSVANDVC